MFYLFDRHKRELDALARVKSTEAKQRKVIEPEREHSALALTRCPPHNPSEECKSRVVMGRLDLASLPYHPWPRFEAKRLEIEARNFYFAHSHCDPDTGPVAPDEFLRCVACRLHGMFGNPPAVEGWERLAVQASQPIRLRYLNRVLRLDSDEFTEEYRDGLSRDIQTFGLVITSW